MLIGGENQHELSEGEWIFFSLRLARGRPIASSGVRKRVSTGSVAVGLIVGGSVGELLEG